MLAGPMDKTVDFPLKAIFDTLDARVWQRTETEYR